MYLLDKLPAFIFLNQERKVFSVQMDDPGKEGSYEIVLAANIEVGYLFTSFYLHVIVVPEKINGYLSFEPPLQLNYTINQCDFLSPWQ